MKPNLTKEHEKAKELIERFEKVPYRDRDSEGAFDNELGNLGSVAKQCALIMCDEVLKSKLKIVQSDYFFYINVKNIIENEY